MLNLFIAHFFNPVPDGTRVQMGEWPLHMSLASNFYLEQSEDEALTALDGLFKKYPSFTTTGIGAEIFGVDKEMRVIVVEPVLELLDLHFGLMDVVENLGGTFDQPQYMGFGYRPHVTEQNGTGIQPGQSFTVDSMTAFTYDAEQDKREAIRTWMFV